MNEFKIIRGPTLRQAAIITIIGYMMGSGVPYISFKVIPSLFVPDNAVRTVQNIVTHQGLFVFTIFGFLFNFIGDIVAAWGLYVLLRPVNAAVSMLVASLRVVFGTVGIAATLHLVTAHRLVTRPAALSALGSDQINTQVHVAFGAFNSQFAFSLIIFGLYLMLLAWLVYSSGYMPKWLGILLAIDGMGWSIMESSRYVFPGINLDFLYIATFGELFLLVWLIGWGTRLRQPSSSELK